MPAGTVDRADTNSGKLYVDLTKDQIKDSPEFHQRGIGLAAPGVPARGCAVLRHRPYPAAACPHLQREGPGTRLPGPSSFRAEAAFTVRL